MKTSLRTLEVHVLILVALVLLACSPADLPEAQRTAARPAPDVHSFSRPDQLRVEHIDLDLEVDFESRSLTGTAVLRIVNNSGATTLHLDTRDLDVHEVKLDSGAVASYEFGEEEPFLGRELAIGITEQTSEVRIDYSTRPGAEALQWLLPEQTAGKRSPFLFSQSQAILARTWVPCQDSPSVRFTYTATVRVPPGLMALMSAENPRELAVDGLYTFRMEQPIPSYLLALAVGDLEFRALGSRTGVYAEPEVVADAVWEFAEVDSMMEATEALYGPYRWGRYDILVLPPSFPFGGMENPRLTFATPTILAGDRSLVALIAHELAHSWSGNLVTNATWNDFWLNEGFTSYIENRIMEKIEGEEYAAMLRSLSVQDLERELADLGPDSPDTHLHLDLTGRNPDEGGTAIAYDKGAAFLRLLEETAGRERWDTFIAEYFDTFAFQSLDTATFGRFLEKHLLAPLRDDGIELDVAAWIHGPGMPDNLPHPQSGAFAAVELVEDEWFEGKRPATELPVEGWSTHEWLHFLRRLPNDLDKERMSELDDAFRISESGNSEILAAWLRASIRAGYSPAFPVLEDFLRRVGRTKFLEPLYEEMARTETGLEWAREIYAAARQGYHPVTVGTLDPILGWDGS